MIYYLLAPYLLHMITFWSLAGIFYLLDCKYLDEKHENWVNYSKAAKCSLKNQLFITLPLSYLLMNDFRYAINNSEYDSLSITILKLFLIFVTTNLLAYFSHYMLHTRFLFRYIHYKHHEFNEPIAVCAFYCHPIEHLVVNSLPLFLPIIIFGIRYDLFLLLIFFGSYSTVTAHVVYNSLFNKYEKLTDIFITKYHTTHHASYKHNYGFQALVDKLFGTFKK